MNTTAKVILIIAALTSLITGQTGYQQVKALLDSMGIKYLADDSKQLCTVPVDGLKNTDDQTIYISPAGEKQDFFVARLTLIDGDENTRFTPELFKKCLIFNYQQGIIKLQFDPKFYDIDITYENWTDISPRDFEKGLGWMVQLADTIAAELKNELGR